MTDGSKIRRAYWDNEITNVAWIRSEQNIADSLTKRPKNNILRDAVPSGKLEVTIKQCICREDINFNKNWKWIERECNFICNIIGSDVDLI